MTAKTRKIIDKAFSITWWAVFCALVALIFGIITAKINGEVPKVFGYSVVKIISPSMGEKIPVGTYVIIKEIAPEDVQEQDIICFYSDDPSIKGYPNLHRVVKPPIQVGDKYEYITKGDANAIEDNVTAKSDNLIGKYVKTMDGLTNLSEAMNSKGMLVLVMTLCVLSVGMITAIVVIKSKDQTDSTDQTK